MTQYSFGAGSALTGQFTTNATSKTDCNDPWRHNNGTYTALHMTTQGCLTRPTGHGGFHNNSLNSSDASNRPTCFK